MIPRHIAIIMDGNGRWARKRKLPRLMGHREGVKSIQKIVTYCTNVQEIEFLTLYAFSTENWKRSVAEVKGLMGLLKYFLAKEVRDLKKNGVQLNFVGDIGALSDPIKKLMDRAVKETQEGPKLVLSLCINYGARDEIVNAVRRIVEDGLTNDEIPANLNEEIFAKYLYTDGISDPDLVIRTAGEMRLSNFLLWQAAYAELYWTDVLWPDFGEEDLIKAIEEYGSRERRFGR